VNQDGNQAKNWGGRRVGAGRKPEPKRRKQQGLVVFPGGRPEDKALVEPPSGLSEAQALFWRQWAPLALEKRTLTTETVPAFTMLCELEVRRRAIVAEFDREGAEATPAGLRLYLQAAKQVEGLMGRFCLAPFGKPVVSEKPKQTANPFAQVAGQ